MAQQRIAQLYLFVASDETKFMNGTTLAVFQTKETGTTTLVYRCVYPDSAMTVTYRFVSAARFDVHAIVAGTHPTTNADARTKT